MKKYVTFVKDETVCKAVVFALNSAGFKSPLGNKINICLANVFIIINDGPSEVFNRVPEEVFTIGIADGCAADCVAGDLTFIDAAAILSDPFQLDGAKQPETIHKMKDGREFSESTIMEAMRHYVKD